MRISNNHIIDYLSVSVVLHFTPLFWIYINTSIFLKMFVMISFLQKIKNCPRLPRKRGCMYALIV